jgi:uncharacterized protein (TIGR03066 family)
MRAILGFGLAVLLVASAGVSADDAVDAKKLIGKWELKELPKDFPAGVTATAEFTNDGKLTVVFTFDGKSDKTEGTYKLDGNKLSVEFKDTKETSTVTKLTDEELTLKYEKGTEEAFKRVKAKK